MDLLDLESRNNAVVHLVVDEHSSNKMLPFLKKLINFEEALV